MLFNLRVLHRHFSTQAMARSLSASASKRGRKKRVTSAVVLRSRTRFKLMYSQDVRRFASCYARAIDTSTRVKVLHLSISSFF